MSIVSVWLPSGLQVIIVNPTGADLSSGITVPSFFKQKGKIFGSFELKFVHVTNITNIEDIT